MATGVRFSYDDTVTTKRSIGDAIYMIDFTEAPLLQLFGFGSENLSKFKVVNWPSTMLEIIEDIMSPFESKIAEDLDNAETEIDVASGHGSYFRKGDVVGILDANGEVAETLLVLSVSGDTLTVDTRGDVSTATTHSNGATIRILTRAMPENHTYTTGHSTVPTVSYNYTQIISQAVEVSKTERAISRYGIEDQLDYQVAKLFSDGGSQGKLAQLLHRTFYYGVRQKRASSGNAYGMMGGYSTFVNVNTTSSDHVFDLNQAAITKKDIHRVLRAIRSSGGRCTHLITGAWGMEKIQSLYEDNIRTTEMQTTRGNVPVEAIRTPHGEVKLVYDFMCPEHMYNFVNAEKIGWIPLRDFEASEMNTLADGWAKDVVGEYTFMVACPKSHGQIYGASTTK